MDRLRASFVVLVLAALLLGGYTAVDTGGSLRAVSAAEMIEPRISAEATGVELREEAVVVTVRMENPTGADLEHAGARFRFHDESDRRLASGAGTRLDDNGSTLPAGGSLRVTYAVRVSESQREVLADALGRDARLSMNLAVSLGDTNFVVRADAEVGGEVG